MDACICTQPIGTCESTAIYLQKRTEKRSDNKEKAPKVCKDKNLICKHRYKPPAKAEILVAIPVTLGALCRAGFPGKYGVTLPFLQAEQKVSCHGQEQPPCCTTVLGLGLRWESDLTALHSLMKRVSSLRFQLNKLFRCVFLQSKSNCGILTRRLLKANFYGAMGCLDKEIRGAGRTKVGVFEDTFIVWKKSFF